MYEIWQRGVDHYERRAVFDDVRSLEDVILQAFALSTDADVGFEDEIHITFRGQRFLTVNRSGAVLLQEFLQSLRNDERVGTNAVQVRHDSEWTGQLGSLA